MWFGDKLLKLSIVLRIRFWLVSQCRLVFSLNSDLENLELNCIAKLGTVVL